MLGISDDDIGIAAGFLLDTASSFVEYLWRGASLKDHSTEKCYLSLQGTSYRPLKLGVRGIMRAGGASWFILHGKRRSSASFRSIYTQAPGFNRLHGFRLKTCRLG